ncbi:MAG: Uncharacterised protein [Opitutia bacterium UBA7350]|nr:MAG: Uncharacterised protein [Opitutae bacterium UBA7350]
MALPAGAPIFPVFRVFLYLNGDGFAQTYLGMAKMLLHRAMPMPLLIQ